MGDPIFWFNFVGWFFRLPEKDGYPKDVTDTHLSSLLLLYRIARLDPIPKFSIYQHGILLIQIIEGFRG